MKNKDIDHILNIKTILNTSIKSVPERKTSIVYDLGLFNIPKGVFNEEVEQMLEESNQYGFSHCIQRLWNIVEILTFFYSKNNIIWNEEKLLKKYNQDIEKEIKEKENNWLEFENNELDIDYLDTDYIEEKVLEFKFSQTEMWIIGYIELVDYLDHLIPIVNRTLEEYNEIIRNFPIMDELQFTKTITNIALEIQEEISIAIYIKSELEQYITEVNKSYEVNTILEILDNNSEIVTWVESMDRSKKINNLLERILDLGTLKIEKGNFILINTNFDSVVKNIINGVLNK